MKLFVYHTPELLPQQGRPQCAIAIDVLRASTTITTALNSGAEAIQVFSDIDELFAASEEFPEENRLRAGERGGKKIAKCDLGNSPLDCTPKNVEGKRLFLSTTNGTRCLESVQKISTVLVAALINRQAVVDYLLKKKPGKVWLVGSGWEGTYSLEDTICAGAIADGILEQSKSTLSKIAGNDELIAAVSLYRQWKGQLQEAMALSSHGQRLNRLRGQKDIAYCCELDTVDLLPVQKQPGVIVVRQPGFFEKLFSGGLFGGGKQKQSKEKALKDAAVKDEAKALPAAKNKSTKTEKDSKQKGKASAASPQPKADAKPKAGKRKALKSAGSAPQPVAKASSKVDKTKAEPAKRAEVEKAKAQKAQAEAAAKAEQAKQAAADKAKAEAKLKAEAEKAKAEKAKAEKAKAEAEKAKAEAKARAEAEKAKAEKAKAEKARAEAEKAKAEAAAPPTKAEPAKPAPATKAEPVKTEAKAEPAKADPAKTETKAEPAEPTNNVLTKAEEKKAEPVQSSESKPASDGATSTSSPATGRQTAETNATAPQAKTAAPPNSAAKPAVIQSKADEGTDQASNQSEKEPFQLPTLKGFTDRLGRLGK